ncbi:GntR family transcriptional regulator [Lampropedia aestuarii]|uniref:GntR family transcriptional regulator n=1 Tax=Lampropedia aestuarii TaxID=2562762 RepID=UPI002468CF4A|nr:GntR family transcriptional regulator [Lampropedia aestuarii]MDH5858275.1 GntR family transcriptional regulator [Lampropedia aestuarii]
MRKVKSAPNRVEQVYAILRDSICDGTLSPGMHLVQEELAAQLEVSRQPVQHAMLLLKADGLVIEHGARGLYVAPMEPENIVHHYQIRLQLDRLAAALVIERLKAEDGGLGEQLKKQVEALTVKGMAAQQAGDAAEAVRLDMEFHSLIYSFSGNPLIASAAEAHWNFLRRVMLSILLHAERGPQVWREHQEILACLLAQDAAATDQKVTEHILGAQAALLKALGQH